MKTYMHVLFAFSLATSMILPGLAAGSPQSHALPALPLAYQTIEGRIVAKGVLFWESSPLSQHDVHLKREYVVLQNSHAFNEQMMLELEPFFTSIDQFQLGETIQAQLAPNGSVVSVNHVY